MKNKMWAVALCGLILVSGWACGNQPGHSDSAVGEEEENESPLVVYSGRNKSLIGPLLSLFQEATGIETEIRYGSTAELTATLLEEGEHSPCDVFLSQDAAALGALSDRGLLQPLPEESLSRVPASFASPKGDWVGLSGRARVVVYNTESTRPEDLPQSLAAVGEPKYKGRFGVAPTNGSFQAHMAAYRALEGEEALAALLAAMAANEPGRYPKNSAIVEAVIQGEVEWGLVNHYYLLRALAENPEAPASNFAMPEGPAAGFLNLAGAAIVSDRPAARQLLSFLLGAEAQSYFGKETFEYPLAEGMAPVAGVLPLSDRMQEQVDFAAVSAALEPTLDAILTSGLLQ
jgi:iron(III) transport system substrate-binding protein